MSELTQGQIDELLERLRTAFPETERPPDTFRTQEMAEAWGVSYETALKRVRKLVKEGRLKAARVRFLDIREQTQTVAGWRFVR